MKLLVVFSVFFCITFAALDEREQWLNFKINHGKSYSNIQEEEMRFSIFKENLKKIEEHNRLYKEGKETYRMGSTNLQIILRKTIWLYRNVNALLGHIWNPVRHYLFFQKTSNISNKFQIALVYEKPLNADIPKSLDWRKDGAVSPVKDQGICSSCWAFSVTGTLESFYYIKNKKMVTFSEQQIVDCDTSNNGCYGGEEAPALEYVKTYGIQPEESYPYEGANKECRYNKSAVYMKISDYVKIKKGDEDAMLTAVATLGPISVALDAMQLVNYEGGVFSSSVCNQDVTDHAVLIVGYGFDEDSGLDYWLVKNSWGADWGEEGYFRIKRGSNECAIAIDCVYPVI